MKSQTAMEAAYGISQHPKDFPHQNEQDAIAEREAREMLNTYAPGWGNRTASPTADPIKVTEYNDECPLHGGAIKKEYEFGAYRDASVITFVGCPCAASCKMGDDDSMLLHRSYMEAEGRARLILAAANKDWRASAVLVKSQPAAYIVEGWEV